MLSYRPPVLSSMPDGVEGAERSKSRILACPTYDLVSYFVIFPILRNDLCHALGLVEDDLGRPVGSGVAFEATLQ